MSDPSTEKRLMSIRGQESPEDVFDDVLSLCAKVLHDVETGPVYIGDLVELRDNINCIRTLISGGQGYKAFTRIQKEPK